MTEEQRTAGAKALVKQGTSAAHRWLDRPGRRWLLGGLATAAISADERRWCRVRWEGDAWAHHFDGKVVYNDRVLRPSRSVDAHLEIFLWDHVPAAGEVVVDVGAGTGTEVVDLARAVGPDGRVIALEAHPGAAAILERVVAANGLANVTVLQQAIADQPGTLRISDGDESVENNLFEGGDVEVPATTIDALVDDLGLDRIDFLKMNIEGAERLAIQGMAGSAERIGHLSISCHDFLGTDWGRTKDEVRTWLEAHGFDVRSRTDPRPWAEDCLYASRSTSSSPIG